MIWAKPLLAGFGVLIVVPLVACGQSTRTVTRTVSTTARAPSAVPPATSTAPAARATASCGTAASHFIKQLQARATDCATARTIATAWLSRVQRGADPSKPIDVSGYRCAAHFRAELATVLCEEGGDPSRPHITFTAQP